MRLRSTTLVALALTGFLAACSGNSGSTDGDASTDKDGGTKTTASAGDAAADGEALATVDGISITVEEFEDSASRRTPESGSSLSDAEKQEVLDRLVAEKLLYKAALEKGLDKDPKVQKVMVNTLLREVVYANVRNSDFTDEELQAYYEANKDDFVVPEKVQIKRILVKVKDGRTDEQAKAEAERLRAEIQKDPDAFKDLAAKHSEDPYRRRGGDVGFVAKTGKPGLDDEVVEKAFTMDVGQLSDVFKSEDGYNVIMVANKRERVERTFQQMKGSVLRKVKNERLKELYDKYVEDLKTGATVDVDTEKLASIDIDARRRPMMPGLSMGRPGPQGPDADGDAEGGDDEGGDEGGDAEGGEE